MKKFILIFITMFMFACGANAQIATENPKLLDNMYISVEAGATTPLDMNSVFPLNTVVGLKLGKEITPVIGTEIVGQLFMNDNNDVRWTHAMIKGNYVGGNLLFNLNNLFDGYPGKPRVFEIKADAGLGWLHRWCYGGNSFAGKTGLDFNFNIGKKRAHTLSISPAVYWDFHKTDGFNKHWAQLGVFVSYIYHFKNSNGTHYFKTYDVGAMTDEIGRLNEELAKKPNEVVVEKVVASEPIIVKEIEGKFIVYFAFNNADINDLMKEGLDSVPAGTYEVRGYASSEGTTEYNKELSQRRADAVASYLKDRGINITSAIGYGVQFGSITGRVVEIVPVK